MEENTPQFRQDDELAFFGSVTASVSHELSNVVCIVHQVTGLLTDLIAGSAEGHPVNVERLKVIRDRLSRQLKRGEEIVDHLNRFAHHVDERRAQLEVNGLIRNLVALAKRFAEMKGASLEAVCSEAEIYLVSDPFGFQHMVFTALERAFDAAGRGDALQVTVQPEKSGAAVTISGPRSVQLATEDLRLAQVKALTAKLGGEIQLREEQDLELLRLEIPDRRS
jgi:C4-dicarboxylate-specific signal transduction histidine kinase